MQNAVKELLGGEATFLGQWPAIGVVLMVRREGDGLPKNTHKLQPPFHKDEFEGPLLCVRMDEEATPVSFKLREYREWQARDIAEFEVEGTDEEDVGEEGSEDEQSSGGSDSDSGSGHSDSEFSPDDDDEEDDDEEDNPLHAILFQKVTSGFIAEHGREPTEEELKSIFTRLNAAIDAQEGSEGEDAEDEDEAVGAGAGAGAGDAGGNGEQEEQPAVSANSPGSAEKRARAEKAEKAGAGAGAAASGKRARVSRLRMRN